MKRLKGTLQVPGDKSITHRALIFAALSKGQCKVYGASPAFDCVSSADCLKQLGLSFEKRSFAGNGGREAALLIKSPGLQGLAKPEQVLFAANSGTSIRLLAGLVAGQDFYTEFDGDDSLRRRPMARVLTPLQEMGAKVRYLQRENYPPFAIQGGNLRARDFKLETASAQVQTAILLAALQAEGKSSVELPGAVRDHTARMFRHIGLPFVQESENKISVERLERAIEPYTLEIPSDISSAAFFMVAAACLPGSELLLTNLSLNPGRDLVLKILRELGADIEVLNERELCQEPVADLLVRGSNLSGSSKIDSSRLAQGIDEIPILALAAAASEASLSVHQASELKVKESDRIEAMVKNLRACGAEVKELDSGFELRGRGKLKGGCQWLSYDDHRIAMTGLVAGLFAEQDVKVDNEGCVAVSYPDFIQDLSRLQRD